MSDFSPREIVSELDRFIIGQKEAKRAVAIALRNRWRRLQLTSPMKEEVIPKNILMIGPTGCGKTEIARRLAKLSNSPFVKVEATKFTEVGYVGRDVEQIIRDLIENSIQMAKDKARSSKKAQAEANAEKRIIDLIAGKNASQSDKEDTRDELRAGRLDDKIVEIDVKDNSSLQLPTIDIPNMPGAQMGMMEIGKMMGLNRNKKKKLTVRDSYEHLLKEEAEKLIDEDSIIQSAIANAESNGVVFIDEIDKVSARDGRMSGAEVSREGVQRDLLPLLEGTNVTTKHGVVKTDHILFIASGAFHLAKPSDLLAELQGRLPIRVSLDSLTENDFVQILVEPENSLIKQYTALIGVEDVELEFTEDGINEIAKQAAQINKTMENIGARRLHTILERILDDISFSASDQSGNTYKIDKELVLDKIKHIAENNDLNRFIL